MGGMGQAGTRPAPAPGAREPGGPEGGERLVLVVNPVAGRGRALRALPRVAEALDSGGVRVRVEVARGLGHAEELAAAAAGGGEVVVAMGGDGLAGRLAGAVAERGGVLGIIPAGRCNDFARTLGLPRDPAAAARLLHRAVARPVDLLRADARAVASSVYMGIDALANELADRTGWPSGRAGYVAACVRVLRRWRPVRYRVDLDGAVHELEGFTVVAANAASFGGGLLVVPGADIADGMADVALFGHASFAAALRILSGVVAGGTHVRRPEVTVLRGRRLTVSADRDLPVYGDGEPLTRLPVTIELIPSAVRILLP
jgi:YegS/Rv2252/BmrU family lipid kinase